MKILIVGGGIGGLTAARALRRAGFRPQVIERAPAWAPVGAGIALGVNAMRVLDRLGAGAAVAARGRAVERGEIADRRGRPLAAMDIASSAPGETRSVAIHRAALHEALYESIGDTPVRLGTTPAAIDAEADRPRVELSDGTGDEYDLVVGADGLRSQVRDLVFGANPPRYAGYTCWRLIVPGVAGIDYPLEMWGAGRRFGLVPIGDGLLYCFATSNAPAQEADPEDGRLQRFRKRFEDFGGAVPAVLERLKRPEQLLHNDIEDVVQAPWHRRRVVLLGDAAHAVTPNLGQGAAMAIEDAAVLAESLAGVAPLEAALAAYESRRRRRVEWVQSRSRRLGRVAQWQSPFACAARNTLLRLLPAGASSSGLRRLFDEPI